MFRGRKIEHQIRFDQRFGRFVVEDKLLVDVSVDVLVVKLGVEIGVDGERLLGLEDVAEGNIFVLLLLALLGKVFWTKNFGGRVGCMIRAQKDVVLLRYQDSASLSAN